MDNLTHSLAGLFLGEVFYQYSLRNKKEDRKTSEKEEGVSSRRLFLTSSIVANNFPDLDLLYSWILVKPLGYLLHHRGHTHTFITAIPQVLILIAVLFYLWPQARNALSRDRLLLKQVFMTSVVGISFHIFLDSLNSFGVHPFYPFDSNWYYGDLLFIVEPFLWVIFGVSAAITFNNQKYKIVLISLILGLCVLLTMALLISFYSLLALIVLACLLSLNFSPHDVQKAKRISLGLAAFCFMSFLGVQCYFSNQSYKEIKKLLWLAPTEKLIDVALTPQAANPFCWSFVSLVENNSTFYQLKRGYLSILPSLIPTESCRIFGVTETGQKQSSLIWLGSETFEKKKLQKLSDENCYFNAWLRFARMPSFNEWGATDLRYFSKETENFSSLNFDSYSQKECPQLVPGWGYPRQDLLGKN